ncbi:DUF541 domain-containing protein [Lacibacter luteus]|uniref:DUF541 domain-containing protein n=1 Tax=Lacibacter luteus TaxID=2508719 RepID=A0A4Q1CNA5_9BACT|nr:SIMPL domain-containing protein [Lacibacter luteus]RXK62294.1 DUF541 domain-containing protein [Lacibacter luteus]
MKQLQSLLVVLLFLQTATAQLQSVSNPYPKTITVSGTAEMEVVPNEIYVQVDLREYKKKGEEKVELEIIKEEFLQHCKSAGIPDSLISIASFEGANGNDWWRKRKKDPQLFSFISYQIKFSESSKMELLTEKLNEEATVGFRVIRAWHTKMTEYRRQTKINAIKSAKEKGIYLTEAIGEKIGQAITITEQDENNPFEPFQFQFNTSNTILKNGFYADDKSESQNINFKKIKIRFTVDVIYALQ